MSARRLLVSVAVASCTAMCGLVPVGAASAVGLPDGRLYEMVTPPENYGSDVYQPINEESFVAGATQTHLPFQSAADGNRVVYVAAPTFGGNELSGNNGGNEYLGTRAAGGGWTQSNLSPAEAASSIFQAFSSDLSVGFLDAVEPLSPTAPGFGQAVPSKGSYDVLYSTSTAGHEYVPFFTGLPPYRSMESFRTAGTVSHAELSYITGGSAHNSRTLAFAGASVDSSHVLFLANDALTGASEGRPAAEGGAGSTFEKQDNLYESVNGQLRLVNVLPNGTTHANATFGGGSKFSHVISNDGSLVFWTDLATDHIYVRENGTSTVEISSVGKYQTASSDGSVVFYTNGDLYEYEVESANTTDLTPGVPVEKVVGASEDGKYVYYVTKGGELTLWQNGTSIPVAATTVPSGEVSPDGHSLAYSESSKRISVYNADSGLVYCASCTAGGTKGTLINTNSSNVYQPRWISTDGSRVFFDSREGLVPQDINGAFDLYEWERPGTGDCSEDAAEGCVYLLSGASSTQGSFFADASESGDDVFLVTRARLTDRDQNELFDLYDVRAHGVVPVSPPACTGTGCQGIPGAPPIFATPSSVTFEGVGNFTAQTQEVKAKPKPKKKIKHKRKSKAKKRARKANGHKRSGSKGGRS